jgi:soluble lytic murein transglycosylase-like protein
MSSKVRRTWSLSLKPASIGLAAIVAILMGDSILAILLSARNAELRREQARIHVRLDSLALVRNDLARILLVRDALIDASSGKISSDQAQVIAKEIDRNAQLYNFDPLLILAVVLTESEGKSWAVGKLSSGTPSGALGVMQVQPATARQIAMRLGIEVPDDMDLLDPAFNLTVGVAYLLQMVHRFSDLRLGIMAYNVGATGLDAGLRGETVLPEEYYRKVYSKYQLLLRKLQPQAPPGSVAGTQQAHKSWLNGIEIPCSHTRLSYC